MNWLLPSAQWARISNLLRGARDQLVRAADLISSAQPEQPTSGQRNASSAGYEACRPPDVPLATMQAADPRKDPSRVHPTLWLHPQANILDVYYAAARLCMAYGDGGRVDVWEINSLSSPEHDREISYPIATVRTLGSLLDLYEVAPRRNPGLTSTLQWRIVSRKCAVVAVGYVCVLRTEPPAEWHPSPLIRHTITSIFVDGDHVVHLVEVDPSAAHRRIVRDGEIFVDPDCGDDSNEGSALRPIKTLACWERRKANTVRFDADGT